VALLVLHVVLRWREDVLAWRLVEPGKSVALGAHPDALAPIPCPPEMAQGFVAASVQSASATVVVPETMHAFVWRGGTASLTQGPAVVTLTLGDRAEITLGEFCLEVSADLHEALPRSRRSPSGAWGALVVAALAHAVVLGLAAQDARADVDRDDERTSTLRGLLTSAELRARGNEDAPLQDGTGKGEGRRVNDKPGDGRAGGGAKAGGDAGKMGDRLARPDAARRFAIPAFDKRAVPSPSRAEVIADANQFGMIGLLGQGPKAPSAPFAKDFSHLESNLAADGALWGRELGASSGDGGLALSGTGEGGGGRGEGIGLGWRGPLGHTDGDAGWRLGGRGSRPPPKPAWRDDWGDYHMVSFRYPPEAIRDVIRRNFGRFRACYQQGLLRNPKLEGRVRVRFVIASDGSVQSPQDAGSDLPDREVVACVVRAFYALHFAATDTQAIAVSYPIVFSPD
jgi:hypothetical protein